MAEAAASMQSLYPESLPPIEGWWFTAPDWDEDGPIQAGSPTDAAAHLPSNATGIVFAIAGRERDISQLTVTPSLGFDDPWDWELSSSFVTDALGEDEIVEQLVGFVELSRRLAASGALLGCSVHRREGALVLPERPVLQGASHLLVCRARDVEQAYVDPNDFWAMWDHSETSGELTVCTRALETMANPDFLIAVYDSQMRAVHAPRRQRNRYPLPAGSHPSEWSWLAERPSALTEVYYDPGDRRVEYELTEEVWMSAYEIRRA